MSTIKIYHNPRCSKSRATLALLEKHGFEPDIIHYLKTSPDADQINRLLTLLNLSPVDIIRTGETVYQELGIDTKTASDASIVKAISENPILLQRPIVVVDDKKAAIGRPPEAVLSIL